MRQFKMSLGINDHAILTTTPAIKPFLVAMGQSNPKWVEPQPAEGEQAATNSLPPKNVPLRSIIFELRKEEEYCYSTSDSPLFLEERA